MLQGVLVGLISRGGGWGGGGEEIRLVICKNSDW